ncbi:hypothetical protein KBC75_03410 [Candidatus Shapirobacteria bacterium]|nr:hypothetical protein [Candidatus Shapirobacteria bacterium]
MINVKFCEWVVYLAMGSLGSGILFGENKVPEKPVGYVEKDQEEIENILAKIKNIPIAPVAIKKKKRKKKVFEPIKKMTLIERIKFVLKG